MSKQVKDGTRHDILARKDTKVTPLYIEQWDCNIYLKDLSVKEVIEFDDKIKDIENQAQRNFEVVLFAVCDKDGNLMFKETDRDELMEKDFFVINYIARKYMQLIENKSQNLDELAKN